MRFTVYGWEKIMMEVVNVFEGRDFAVEKRREACGSPYCKCRIVIEGL